MKTVSEVLIDLSLPVTRAWQPFSIANGDNLATGSYSTPESTKRKRGQFTDCIQISLSESKVNSVLCLRVCVCLSVWGLKQG